MAELRVTYAADGDGTGQLKGAVESEGFSGHGSAWFDRAHLKKTVIPALRAFPLSADTPPTIEGGFYDKDRRGALDQCHLRIMVEPYGSRGHLLLRVDLATEWWTTPNIDKQHSITVRFIVDYAALDQFATDLDRVLEGTCDEAILRSTTT
jgi:hypothetical protein